MPKSLHSSLECPDTLADRLEGHRFGVAATATLALFAALVAGNMLSVRAEESPRMTTVRGFTVCARPSTIAARLICMPAVFGCTTQMSLKRSITRPGRPSASACTRR